VYAEGLVPDAMMKPKQSHPEFRNPQKNKDTKSTESNFLFFISYFYSLSQEEQHKVK